jgi:hypothetical protein
VEGSKIADGTRSIGLVIAGEAAILSSRLFSSLASNFSPLQLLYSWRSWNS